MTIRDQAQQRDRVRTWHRSITEILKAQDGVRALELLAEVRQLGAIFTFAGLSSEAPTAESAALPEMTTMVARYEGVCRTCNGVVSVGDRIRYGAGTVLCWDCGTVR